MKRALSSRSRRGPLLFLALMVMALILRSPLTAIAPVVNDLRHDLAISPITAGLLTSIPVLCFGLLTPLAALIIGRLGMDRAIMLTLAGALAGLIIRSAGGLDTALTGTLTLGITLTIGNIVSLMVIARDFPTRIHQVTGAYASALNVGTMLTSALTAPIAQWLGWRVALAAAAILVVPAMILWWRAGKLPPPSPARHSHGHSSDHSTTTGSSAPADPRPYWRRPAAWLCAVAFAAHVLAYYGLTAWLPTFLIDRDSMTPGQAGLAASAFQILALLGSFGIPALAGRGRISVPLLLTAVGGCWLITPLGLLAWPSLWIIWAVTAGIAAGGGFTAIFMLIMAHAATLDENRRMSALVQGIGYALASGGPLAVGALHQMTEGWIAPMGFLAMAALVVSATGLGLTRLAPPSSRHG